MNRTLFSKALGVAVEKVYFLGFEWALSQLDSDEVLSDDVFDQSGAESVHWTCAALQQLDAGGVDDAVELAITVTDGWFEERISVSLRRNATALGWSEVGDAFHAD